MPPLFNPKPLKAECIFWYTTGDRAACVTTKVEEGSNIAVFGAGCVGPLMVQSTGINQAAKNIVMDPDPLKKAWAEKFGTTDFVNPNGLEG
jgi:S-(hydroxymethyl)glutathione dehydrogenase/alcohol dehydrogenase